MSVAVLILKDAVVTRGQHAWSRIKATAAEQRELWRQVGEALAYGRAMHPSDQKFSQWCKDNGFDMSRKARADAMWWASVYSDYAPPEGLSHPSNIRESYNEQQSQAALPDDLKDTSITTQPVPSMDTRTAEKVGKLARRAESKDEGSEIAKRHIEALAKKNGVSTEELTEAASIQAPKAFYQFTPSQLELLSELKESIQATIPEMEASGLTVEVIAKVFINEGYELLKGVGK